MSSNPQGYETKQMPLAAAAHDTILSSPRVKIQFERGEHIKCAVLIEIYFDTESYFPESYFKSLSGLSFSCVFRVMP